jgi:hypothetical protein
MEVFDAMEARAIQAVPSTATLVEVLVQPLAKGAQEFAFRYEQSLRGGPSLTLRSLDPGLAPQAAQLRGRYQLRTPDAIHIAAAIEFGAHACVDKCRHGFMLLGL